MIKLDDIDIELHDADMAQIPGGLFPAQGGMTEHVSLAYSDIQWDYIGY